MATWAGVTRSNRASPRSVSATRLLRRSCWSVFRVTRPRSTRCSTRLLTAAGHEVLLSFSRDPGRLETLAAGIGERARAGTVAEASRFGEVVMLSVPWGMIPTVIEQAGSLGERVVIDTTNQYGPGGVQPIPDGLTAAQFNQRRLPGALVVKAFNTLTAGFQASQAGRPAAERVVLFMCGDHAAAKLTVAGLISDAGFAAADLGGLADAGPMEAPRRPGGLYGEEYRPADAETAVAALRAGRPLPPTVFPGLTQCESYARTLFDRGGYALGRIDELVAARMERQAVIGCASLTAIIDELVLRRCVGSPAVMAEQCGYVASMAERREITLHVVPEGTNIGTGGALDIAASNHGTTVCLTTGLDDVTSTAPDVIAKAMQIFERILGAALPCAESLAIVRTAERS